MKITKWYDETQVVYESKKETIREVVIEAISSHTNLSDAEFMHVRFYGKGGSTKITKTQVEAFHAALGVVVTD